MKFRTEINCRPSDTDIDYADHLLLLGSCFADNIRQRMQALKFNAGGNFTGALFNPQSIAAALQAGHGQRHATLGELHRSAAGDWFHYQANTLIDGPDADTVLTRYNQAVDALHTALHAARVVIVTFGTAWVYRLRETGEVVANCHKQPAALFRRERLGVEEIVRMWTPLLESILKGKRVIFTVSPIRHLGDGLEDNSLSKAILRVAVAELCERFPDCSYFPAYEILIDDLRDYRFYAEDMTHPSPQSIDYIWEHFCATHLSARSRRLLPEVSRLLATARHRPLHPQSEAYRQLCGKCISAMRALEKSDEVDFSQEINALEHGFSAKN